MMSHAYDRHLQELVEEGRVSVAQVDEAVRRVLLLKFRLGLFERPYTPATSEKERFFRPQSMDIAARLAAESMVLLKNENKTLPLTDKKKIAVIGPMAKNGWDLLGSWCGHGKIRMLPCSIMDWLLNLQEKLNCVMQQAVLRKEITKKDLQKHWKLHAGLM